MLKTAIIFVYIVLSFSLVSSARNEEKWPRLCSTGNRQSPIDILTADLVVGGAHDPLRLDNYDRETKASIRNSGETILVTLDNAKPLTVSGGDLGDTYTLAGLHFHWGSEHTIDGERADLEMHFVHYSTKYPGLVEALKHDRGVAVLAVLNQVTNSVQSEIALDHLLVSVPEISNTTKLDVTLEKRIRPSELLPKKYSNYYRYEGSLTTPSCNEVVVWTLLADFAKITSQQLEELASIFDLEGNHVKTNYRVAQALNGRRVTLYEDEEFL